eukprot:1148661-Pelagomonas_calceolata.AAC.2
MALTTRLTFLRKQIRLREDTMNNRFTSSSSMELVNETAEWDPSVEPPLRPYSPTGMETLGA